MKNNKNYISDESLNFYKHFVIVIMAFNRILIVDHILVIPTSNTTLYSMMDSTDETVSSAVTRAAARFPYYCPDGPAIWFAQAEAQFELASITYQRIKFNYVESQLNQQ
jgi:hypothetical protein